MRKSVTAGGKLVRNLPACFCFHTSAMIKTCTYLFFHSCKPQKWRILRIFKMYRHRHDMLHPKVLKVEMKVL